MIFLKKTLLKNIFNDTPFIITLSYIYQIHIIINTLEKGNSRRLELGPNTSLKRNDFIIDE